VYLLVVLSGKQRRHLRGLGHHLDAVVQVGKDGLDEGVVGALDAALEQHELIKVRLLDSVGADRHGVSEALAEASTSELVQVLGRTLLLYRARKKDPKIVLP
jgi:RNA-binding protein